MSFMADLIDARRMTTWAADREWTGRAGPGGALERTWRFPDFAAALRFVDAVGALAEAQGHHPDLHLHDYDRVTVRTTTHSAGGPTEHDLELAERVDELQ